MSWAAACFGLAFFVSTLSLAEGVKCRLDSAETDYPSHTKVEADLNGDGVKDLFFLAGEEDVFQTCIFLGKKGKSKIEYDLVHSHSDFYDTVFDFDGSKAPQILVPVQEEKDCGEGEGDGLQTLIPPSLKDEIKKSYGKWAKGYEAYNFTYNMPDVFPVGNLFLLNEVKIYRFIGRQKTDVTAKMSAYLKLKRKVLTAVIKEKGLPKKCKTRLKTILDGIR